MKVFLFSKENSEEKNKKVNKLKLSGKSQIKSVTISNPKKSSSLYIIHGLKIRNKNNNVHSLKRIGLYGNNNNNDFKEQKKEEPNIYFNNMNQENHVDKLQLKEVKIRENNNISNLELLDEQFVIILPGGSIAVEFNNELEELDGEISIEKTKI
ncbi:hypothetical protein C3495_12830 [Clostridiaceae bacterium 14S0207]|nr:hypothetical protein C3495_12830 [Clostridiaceae bacterium 14S0207]